MKRISLIVLFILLISASGCGKAATGNAPSQTDSPAPSESAVSNSAGSAQAPTDLPSATPEVATTESTPNPTPTPKPLASVQFDIEEETYAVEVGEIEADADGRPCVTIYSAAISASIGGKINAMVPFVPCALLESGDIIAPRILEASLLSPEGEKISGFAFNESPIVAKESLGNALGSWPDGKKGCLLFAYDTTEPIKDIIIGAYSDYAKSNYDAFLSSGVSSTK